MKKCWMLAQLIMGARAAASYRCVFMHGLGWANSSAATPTDTDEYWGGDDNINKLTPYCSSRTFVHQETLRRAWDNRELQRDVCEVALGEGSVDTVIRDTVFFAHSEGNLIFADALRNNVCSMDASSHFVAIASPWSGTKAGEALEQSCSNSTIGDLFHWLADELNRCDPDRPGKAFHGYESMSSTYPAFAGLAEFAATQVSFAMCGRSSHGLLSRYSPAMEMLSHTIGFGEANDGMVQVSSCLLPGKTYQNDWQSAFYDAEVNHVDGTLRDGDGSFGFASRQPATWVASLFAEHGETVFV